MNKLDIKHLAPYLPYDLQFYCSCPDSGEYEILGISEINLSNEYVEIGATEFDFSDLGRDEVKPILRPISDLTKEIEHEGKRFVPTEVLMLNFDDDDIVTIYNYITRDILGLEDVFFIKIDGRAINFHHDDIDEYDKLAVNDGFESVHQFCSWFDKDFTGKIIHWTDLKY